MSNLTEREIKILELKNQGMTYAAIGEEFGISDSRVGQIYHNALGKVLIQQVANDAHQLTFNDWLKLNANTKIYRALRGYVSSYEEFLNIPDEKLFRIRNLGAQSIDDIHNLKTKLQDQLNSKA